MKNLHLATKILLFENLIMIIGTVIINVRGLELIWNYQIHKYLHLLGVILFLGNIIVTGVWMLMAERIGNSQAVAFASIVIHWMDVFFTAPGVTLLLWNGFILSGVFGGYMNVKWILWGLGLFSFSGILWYIFLIPLQNKIAEIGENVLRTNKALPDNFYVLLHKWYFFGILATITPLVSMWFMVMKSL